MSATDRTLLQLLFTEQKALDAPTLDEGEYFELFVPYHYLKRFDLDLSNIDAGIVDGPGDGGVDAFYALLDGRLISDYDPSHCPKGAELSIHIFSTKYIESFKTGVLADIRVTLNDILGLDDERFLAQKGNYNFRSY